MRKNYTKISLILVFFIIVSNFTFFAEAAPTQWFPQIGTQIEHKMSSIVKYYNDTLLESNKFNLYSLGGGLYLMPKPLDDLMVNYLSFVSVFNNTEISIDHSYSEASSTELNRTTTLIVNNTEYNEKYIYWLYFTTNSSYGAHIFHAQSVLVKKSDFITVMYYDFLDYIDNTLGPGAQVLPDHNVLAVTKDQIIVLDTLGYDETNYTHISDRTGKVQTYVYTSTQIETRLKGVESFSFVLSCESKTSSIPSFPLDFIILSAGLAIILMVKRSIKTK